MTDAHRMLRGGLARSVELACALACALLPGCYLSHERGAGADAEVADAAVADAALVSCAVEMASRCTGWESAGPPALLSAPVRVEENVRFGSAIVRDCGVLAAWSVLTTTPTTSSMRFETRTAAWSGAPLAEIVAHPSLTLDGSAASAPQLARGPGGAAGVIAADSGCLFVPLDLDGRERGMPIRVATGESCGGLAATPSGYSFVTTQLTAPAQIALHSVDAAGMAPSVVLLPAAPRRAFWSRTVFEDGSFLAYTFSQDFVTSVYSAFLQRFDVRGLALASEVEVGENGVPVLVSPTPGGALAAWMTAMPGGLPLRIRPIDRDGRPAGETRDAPAEGALYGHAIAPTPDGDAVLAWIESHIGETIPWRMRIAAVGRDGALRGAVTTVPTEAINTAMQILVEPSGGRAFVVYRDETGVRAQPLTCVR